MTVCHQRDPSAEFGPFLEVNDAGGFESTGQAARVWLVATVTRVGYPSGPRCIDSLPREV
jgi:hypothetical protein